MRAANTYRGAKRDAKRLNASGRGARWKTEQVEQAAQRQEAQRREDEEATRREAQRHAPSGKVALILGGGGISSNLAAAMLASGGGGRWARSAKRRGTSAKMIVDIETDTLGSKFK